MSRLDAIIARPSGMGERLYFSDEVTAVSVTDDGRQHPILHLKGGGKAYVHYGDVRAVCVRMKQPGFWRRVWRVTPPKTTTAYGGVG